MKREGKKSINDPITPRTSQLSLRRETLRVLSAGQLRQVLGGEVPAGCTFRTTDTSQQTMLD